MIHAHDVIYYWENIYPLFVHRNIHTLNEPQSPNSRYLPRQDLADLAAAVRLLPRPPPRHRGGHVQSRSHT